jgi:hypothetical protein
LTYILESFRHELTGAKRPQRDEAKSGIIADDMGLGKTLVVLSAIARSLDEATVFMSSRTGNQASVQAVSRATLIMAPSTRKVPLFQNLLDTKYGLC